MGESEVKVEAGAEVRTVRSVVMQGFWIAVVANAVIVVVVFLTFYGVPRGSFVRPMGLACGVFVVWVAVLGLEVVLMKDLIKAESRGDSKGIAVAGLLALGMSPMVVSQCAVQGFMWMWDLAASP